ncbi:hypothetical protein ACOJUR_08410 [Alicyclobacillus tolerans]|uniref:hypothetical protein n=1 Tax=Alicyclobacillus tolerans TaxID=90970 RepID=UPI003B7BE848
MALSASMVAAPTTVMAAQSPNVMNPQYAYTDITWNDNYVNAADHLVVTDPWSGSLTSALPLYYINEALGEISGLSADWNGNTRELSISVPGSVSLNMTNLPKVQNTMAENEMAFVINGQVVAYAPYFVAKDPASGIYTSYVPIYYLGEVVKRLGVTEDWNGTHLAYTFNLPAGMQSSGTGSSAPATKLDMVEMIGGWAAANMTEPDGGQTVHEFAPPANAGTDPFTDVPQSDWPLVKVWTNGADNYGLFKPETSTLWGANQPVTLTMANEMVADLQGIAPTEAISNEVEDDGWFQGSGWTLNSYEESFNVDNGLTNVSPNSDLTVGQLQQIVQNLKMNYQGYEEIAPNTYKILPFGNSPQLVSPAGMKWFNQIVVKIEGNEIVATMPGVTENDFTVGAPWISAETSTNATTPTPAPFSTDGGQTWQVAPENTTTAEYNFFTNDWQSYDRTGFTPKTIMMKGLATAGFGVSSGVMQANQVWQPNGFAPTFICGVQNGQFGVKWQ